MPDNDDFVRSIENATAEVVKKVAANVRKACMLIEADAKKNCPVDQGFLRSSMFSDVSVSISCITGAAGNNSETAPYVHQGTGIYAVEGDGRKTPWRYEVKAGKYKGWHITRGQRAQPFLQKARDDNKGKITRILGG